MKKLIGLVVCLLVATASQSWAGSVTTRLKAKISGTVKTQIVLGISDGRIGSSSLNNKRVFQEFGVTEDLYELVFNIGSGTSLELVPKSTLAKLPTLTVFTLEDTQDVADTKAHILRIGAGLSSPATNLFQNLAGAVAGTLKYTGDLGTGTVTKVSFDGHALGTNIGGGSPTALLTFKVSTQGPFVPTGP